MTGSLFGAQLTIEDAILLRESAPPSEAVAYLRENPGIFRAFEREALAIWRTGKPHYSARTIIEVLRHHSALSADPAGVFKVNNNLSRPLALEFMRRHPECGHFFETRRNSGASY